MCIQHIPHALEQRNFIIGKLINRKNTTTITI